MKSKKVIVALLFFCSFLILGIPSNGLAIHTVQKTTETTDCTLSLFAPLQLSDLSNMSRKEVEQKINRRLKFQERLTLRLLKRHVKRMDKLDLDSDACSIIGKKARNSILFGIVGFLFAGIIFGGLAVNAGLKAVKLANENPDCPESEKRKRRGNIGIVIGVIDIVAALIFIVAAL